MEVVPQIPRKLLTTSRQQSNLTAEKWAACDAEEKQVYAQRTHLALGAFTPDAQCVCLADARPGSIGFHVAQCVAEWCCGGQPMESDDAPFVETVLHAVVGAWLNEVWGQAVGGKKTIAMNGTARRVKVLDPLATSCMRL